MSTPMSTVKVAKKPSIQPKMSCEKCRGLLTLETPPLDPRDMRFTGAAIEVYSTFARETAAGGLTWRQLDAAIQGLQNAMLAQGKYKEAQFTVFDGLTAKPEQGGGWLYGTTQEPDQPSDVA